MIQDITGPLIRDPNHDAALSFNEMPILRESNDTLFVDLYDTLQSRSVDIIPGSINMMIDLKVLPLCHLKEVKALRLNSINIVKVARCDEAKLPSTICAVGGLLLLE
tara:strand:- start:498 stop:818 length:321 start_codon:yes stop_codon:yes gene_type:complete